MNPTRRSLAIICYIYTVLCSGEIEVNWSHLVLIWSNLACPSLPPFPLLLCVSLSLSLSLFWPRSCSYKIPIDLGRFQSTGNSDNNGAPDGPEELGGPGGGGQRATPEKGVASASSTSAAAAAAVGVAGGSGADAHTVASSSAQRRGVVWISPFKAVNNLMHVLLLVQLSYITSIDLVSPVL